MSSSELHRSLVDEFSDSYSDIPSKYTWEHLWKYKCYKLKTARLKKKFRKNPKKYVGKKVRSHLSILDVGRFTAEIIRNKMHVEGFARKILIGDTSDF